MAQAKTRGISLPYLAAWRHAAFLTQRDLAKLSGVSQSSITQLETGEHTARVATIDKLARALGITREHLVNEDPGKKTPAIDATDSRPRKRRAVNPKAATPARTA